MSCRASLTLLAVSFAACDDMAPSATAEQIAEEVNERLYVAGSRLWSPSNIPVCWENATAGNAVERGWVRNAVKNTWEAQSAVTFTGWAPCAGGASGLRIQIADVGPHAKALGKDLAGMGNGVVLNFTFANWGTECQSSRQYCIEAIAVHEFGHALGFSHEQNRPDTPTWCDQEQGSDGDWLIGVWDLDSVMNYCNPYWNGDGNLSVTDIAGLRAAYGVHLATVVAPNAQDSLKGDFVNLVTGDFNGDGRTDLIRQEKSKWDDDAVGTAEVWLSNGNGLFTVTTPAYADSLKGDYTNLVAGDFNGDKRTDFIRQEKAGWDDDAVGTAEVWLSNGNGTFARITPNGQDLLKGDYTNLIVGDYNGDGRTDFIRQEKGGWDDDVIGTADVWLSNGNGTFARVTPGSSDDLKGDYTNLVVGDYNGDKRADFIRQEKSSWDDDAVGTADVWLSNGNGAFTRVTPKNSDMLKGDFTNLVVGDYNGDGRTDFLRQEKGGWDDDAVGTADVWLSNGNGTFAVVGTTNPDVLKGDYTALVTGDFNGDKRTDFLRQERGGWDDDAGGTAQLWHTNGDGTFTIVTPSNQIGMKGDFTNLVVGDFNGDGRSDFLVQEKGGWDDDAVRTAEIYLLLP